MIFKGIAPSVRHTDPEFFRYELRMHWHYILARFTEFANQMNSAITAFGRSLQKVGESMRRFDQMMKNVDWDSNK